MTYFKENLWERFFNRLPASEANDAIRTLKQGGDFRDVDFFTLKEAEQKVGQFKLKARAAISAYKSWKTERAVFRLFTVFTDREGAHLRAHARAMTSIWLDARRDYHDLTALLMRSVANDALDDNAGSQGGRHE